MDKHSFDIDLTLEHIREAVKPFPPAAMFQLADEGYNSLFEQLIACILSIRTYDEVALPAAKTLFALARTPVEMLRLTPRPDRRRHSHLHLPRAQGAANSHHCAHPR